MCSREDLDETYKVLDELCKIISNPNPNDLKLVEKIKNHKSDMETVIDRKNEEIQEAMLGKDQRTSLAISFHYT
jgi:hypothetical protein